MDRIEKSVNSLIHRYHTNSPFELCDKMDISIIVKDLPDCVHGFFVQILKNHVIVLSSSLPQQERPVICAHELGHIILHDGMNSFEIQNNTNLCLPRYEREADYFAACLLLDNNRLFSRSEDTLTTARISAVTGIPESLVKMRFEHLLSYQLA